MAGGNNVKSSPISFVCQFTSMTVGKKNDCEFCAVSLMSLVIRTVARLAAQGVLVVTFSWCLAYFALDGCGTCMIIAF